MFYSRDEKHTSIYSLTCAHARARVYTHTQAHTSTRAHTTCIHTQAHTNTHTRARIHAHTSFTHSRIHMHTCARACAHFVRPLLTRGFARYILLSQVLRAAEIVFAVLWTFEAATKICAYGFVLPKRAYLRGGWNRIDAAILVASWASIVLTQVNSDSDSALIFSKVLPTPSLPPSHSQTHACSHEISIVCASKMQKIRRHTAAPRAWRPYS